MGEILTAAEVADLLHIHPRTVYKLARKGLIPAGKFGGSWRFSKKEILKIASGSERRDGRGLSEKGGLK